MYQARRLAQTPGESLVATEGAVAAALRSAPRRAAVSPLPGLVARFAPAGLSLAMVATAGAIVVGTGGAGGRTATAVPETTPVRADQLSRQASRAIIPAETETPAPVAAAWASSFGTVVATWHAQSAITVRSLASAEAAEVGRLQPGDKVQVTDRVSEGFREVVLEGRIGWVPAGEVAEKAPAPGAGSGGVALSPGRTSSTRVLGLTPQAMGVYNAVMGQWGGEINSVGGWRARSLSDHQYGRAIDFMLTPGKESALGWTIAKYLAANAGTLGVDHIIFEQKIWTPNSGRWRPMASRGSITANHYDHVHVSVER